jgi:YVTN family beta-propeller protein
MEQAMRTQHSWVAASIVLALLGGCGSADKATAGAAGPNDTGSSGNGGGTGGSVGTAGTGSGAPQVSADAGVAALPPETEATIDLQLPQASNSYVYATNPAAGTVSVIDAKSRSIRTIDTGEKPTYLRTLKDSDNAIVLNIGSDTATVIRSTASAVSTTDKPVVQGANAIGIAPNAAHAVVYYNSSYASAGNTSGSFQDVTVLTLTADGKKDTATSMTVGFRPRDVFFSDDGTRAFVVTEDGVSVLDFADIEKNGSSIARLIAFGGGVDQKTLDVAVTPDGKYALARAEGKSVLQLIDLSSGSVKTLDVAKAYVAPPPVDTGDDAGVPAALPVIITDLDLVPTGKAAIAVLRNQAAMVTLPLPAAFDDPKKASTRTVEGETVGSVSVTPDGHTALLYTTAANAERITIVDLDTAAEPHVVALRKAVKAVTFTPDGHTALITHTKLDGDPNEGGITPDLSIDRSFGYSLLRVPSGDVKLQVTKTDVGPIAMVSDISSDDPLARAGYLFILFRNDTLAIREVHRVSLASFLVEPIIQLESPPISIGSAPASGNVFVNQDHPDGRMTFIDWKSPDTKNTVTGFELNSRIRD